MDAVHGAFFLVWVGGTRAAGTCRPGPGQQAGRRREHQRVRAIYWVGYEVVKLDRRWGAVQPARSCSSAS